MDACLALVTTALLSGCGGGNGSDGLPLAGTSGASMDGQISMRAQKGKPDFGSDIGNDPSMIYVKVADQGGSFKVDSRTTVRYGTADGAQWVSRSVTGTGQC